MSSAPDPGSGSGQPLSADHGDNNCDGNSARSAHGETHSRRVMFLEGEIEKLLEFGQQCSRALTEEMQTLLGRFESQKGALERLMKSQDHGDSADGGSWLQKEEEEEEPPGLSEECARLHLLKVRRVMQEFSRAVCQSSLRPALPRSTKRPTAAASVAAAAAGPGGFGTIGRGRRGRAAETRPARILDGLEALDIALVVNLGGELRYRAGRGVAMLPQAEPGWSQLPEQTLYCAVSDSRQIVVVDTLGRRLTAFGIDSSRSGGQSRKTENFERVSYMRASAGLIVSDYHSLYICDLCGGVRNSLHTFGWIVGHCVDEASRRLYIVDRVNEHVSVYCLDSLQELPGLVHKGFTEGISSVCLLHRQLLVSDRGANKIFAFSSESLDLLFQVTIRCPMFLTTDFHRFVYVTVGGRDNTVKILDSRGRLHRRLGQFGSPGGLSVAVDCSELFVCDLDSRRIQVFNL